MKLTSIKQQVKSLNRYSLYVDGAYSFSLSESALLESGLVSGRELTSQEIDDYKKLSQDDKAYGRALRYVAARQRSTGELQLYLKRKQVAPEQIEQAIEKLTDLGLLDDYAYARSFVNDRRLLRSSSRRKLIMELRKKYVSSDAIKRALESDTSDDITAIRQMVERKRRQTKYQDDTKLMQYLARQGFSYGDIKTALVEEPDY